MTRFVWLRGFQTAGLCTGLLLTGCNFSNFFQNPNTTTTTTTSGSDYIYVVNSNSTLSAFSVASGALTAVSGNPISPGTATSVTVNRQNTFVYAGGTAAIYCFALGTGGVLTQQTPTISVGTYGVVSLETSPDGHWLFALEAESGLTPQLSVYGINTTTGALTLGGTVLVAPSATGGTGTTNASSVRISPNGDFVGVALGGGGDAIYPFNTTTGALGAANTLSAPTGYEDNVLIFDSTSEYVFIGRYGLTAGTGSVASYSVNSTGGLTSVSSVPSGNAVKSLLLNATGTDLYTANFSDGTISGYSVSGGTLTQLSGSPFASSPGVSSLARDNSGKYLIAAATDTTGTTDLTLYQFDALATSQLDALAQYGSGSGAQTGATGVAATH